MAKRNTNAVINHKKMSWLAAGTGPPQKKPRRLKPNHPIFHKMSKVEEDKCWSHIFDEMAVGKFPKCFSYRSGKFAYSKKSMFDSILLPDDVAAAAEVAKNFIRSKTVLMSSTDVENEKKKIQQAMVVPKKLKSWKEITKLCVGDILISNYAIRMAKKHNISIGDTKKLCALIEISIVFGNIDESDIILVNNRIETIIGLVFLGNGVDDLFGVPFMIDQEHRNKQRDDRPKGRVADKVCIDPNNKLATYKKVNLFDKWVKETRKLRRGVLRVRNMEIHGSNAVPMDEEEFTDTTVETAETTMES